MSKALQLANKVIAEAEANGLVSWTTSAGMSDDIVMKSEHLISLSIENLAVKTANYFSIEIIAQMNSVAQYVSANRLMSIYEVESVGASDFRFQKQFIPNTVILDGKNAYTPLKFFGTVTTKIQKSFIPLMRIPEAYYIAAECYLKQNTPDIDNALEMLNFVRQKRGITSSLTGLSSAQIMDEIVKEYAKEFYCEGVMFYLYKRLGKEEIPGYNPPATDAVYQLPYPETELQMGRSQ